MKFILRKASDYKFEEEIEINTLDELMELIHKESKVIIYDKALNESKENEIVIYDDYWE